ncbi:MAG: dienelactone hydrolase family protein, partial [Bryobacteraceae bacterium]|nr:dienelactone hydrolase family protein [Bryobacteraceae bacterium]
LFALHHGVHSQFMPDWYARGYTPAGIEVWNAIRAIDYLETRPEVDKTKIGMTGRSGGAAMTWFTAAVEPRIKVAVPVMGISTYAANVKANTQEHHCDCMFCINVYKHDMTHQGAHIAPRPLLMAHGEKDPLFPVPGYTEFEQLLTRLYAAYNRPDAFRNIVVPTGHADSDFLREQAIRWFDKFLMAIPERKLDMDYSNAPPEQLAVFAGKTPADARNHTIHETFTTRPPSGLYQTAAQWQTRRVALDAAIQKLLPPDGPIAPPRTEIYKPQPRPAKVPALLYIACDGDNRDYHRLALAGVHTKNTAVRMAVYPIGIDEIPWPNLFQRDTLRNAMHIGETIDSLRLRDVRAALQQLREMPEVDPARIMIAGRGVSGILGLYAAILDPAIWQVALIDPPTSHRHGPLFLNILRHTDLPEAAALLAPRRLIFYGHMPKEYEYTRHVYTLLGQPGHLSVAMNLEYVLEGRYDHGMASGR